MRSEFISEKLNGRIPNCTRKEYSEMLAIYYATEDRNKAKAQATYYLKGRKKYTNKGPFGPSSSFDTYTFTDEPITS